MAVLVLFSDGELLAKLQTLFILLDLDGDGLLSEIELIVLMKSIVHG
jgi:hypothetical protein